MYAIELATYEITTAFDYNERIVNLASNHIWNATSTNFTNTFGTLLYFWKTLKLTIISFVPRGNAVIFRIRVSLWRGLWYNKFWSYDLDGDLWPSFENFNIGSNFLTLRDMAFIFGMFSLITRLFRENQNFSICDLERDLWSTFEKL